MRCPKRPIDLPQITLAPFCSFTLVFTAQIKKWLKPIGVVGELDQQEADELLFFL